VEAKTQSGVSRVPGWGSLVTLVGVVPVLVIDVSEGGCLLETHQPFEPGRTGTLRVTLDGGSHLEDLRVTRCLALPGRGSTYGVGAEFLRTPRSGGESLRHAIGRLIGGSSRRARGTRSDQLLEERQ